MSSTPNEKINKTVKKWLKHLNMEDWVIRVTYKPDKTTTDMAEVFPIPKNRTADMVVYTVDCNLDEVIFHELMHCKIGLLCYGYQEVIDRQNQTIKELMEWNEEAFLEEMATIVLDKKG